jgi:hypothetical protein
LDCGGDEPFLTTYESGISITEQLRGYSEREPLSGRYFAVKMVGQKSSRRAQIRPIKIRDLEEDFHFSALTAEQIKEFLDQLWDASSVERSTREELQRIADDFE